VIGVITAASFQIRTRLTIHDHWPISFDDNESVYSVLGTTQLNNQRINQNKGTLISVKKNKGNRSEENVYLSTRSDIKDIQSGAQAP
jgi:hypothetical protein